MIELAKWGNFYVFIGSAAGALIGLQFVVVTLIADRPTAGSAEAGAAFGTPTIVHFSAALLLSALMLAPWKAALSAAVMWGVLGFLGLIYCAVVTRRMARQNIYKPEFEDWLFHCVLCFSAYAILAASAFMASLDEHRTLFAPAAAAILLLFIGIHNAWDGVTYHVFVSRRSSPQAEYTRSE